MENLSVKMQKLILWVSSYANILAILLSGGYILRFGKNEEVKKTAIDAFLANAVFLCISMILQVTNGVAIDLINFSSAELLVALTLIFNLVKIIFYLIKIIPLFFDDKKQNDEKEEWEKI